MSINKPVLVTVNGTGEPDPFGGGFDADVGRAFAINPWNAIADQIDGLETDLPPVFWAPVGYPAAVFPMNPSVSTGRAALRAQIDTWHILGNPLFASGYSQGAIVVGMWFLLDVLPTNGVHHNLLPDLANGGVVNFGDPLRAPGVANGNKAFGFPMPTVLQGQVTGGIAGPLDMTPAETPDWWLSCALDGDLYASCPVGSSPWHNESGTGKVETGVYNFVESGSPVDFLKIALDLAAPISTIKAIYNGLKFASQGMNAPHWQYGPFVGPAVNWILDRVDTAPKLVAA